MYSDKELLWLRLTAFKCVFEIAPLIRNDLEPALSIFWENLLVEHLSYLFFLF